MNKPSHTGEGKMKSKSVGSPVCTGHFATEAAALGYLNSRDRLINIISIFRDYTDGQWKVYYQYLD
jgi:hypothetical protein